MRRIINRALEARGYKIIKTETLDRLFDDLEKARRARPFDWVDEYASWTERVFGQRLLPSFDPDAKINSSVSRSHQHFALIDGALSALEDAFVMDLLSDLRKHSVPGIIAEFGVYQGGWLNRLHDLCEKTKFCREIWGFDSFQGLSRPDQERDDPFWKEGMFSAGLQEVRERVKAKERPHINLVEGWFSESLLQEEAQSVDAICYARVDCDIYQPTVECLEYLGPRLPHGAVLVFDDWSHDHNTGETRAFAEWQPLVPHLEFQYLFHNVRDHFYVRVWHKDEERW